MAENWQDSEIGTAWKLGYAALCLAVFAIFAAFSQPDRGVVAGFATAATVLAAKLRWDACGRSWFWVTIGVIVIAHAALIYAWGWRINIKPTILLAPLALADFIVVISAIFVVEKIVGRNVEY